MTDEKRTMTQGEYVAHLQALARIVGEIGRLDLEWVKSAMDRALEGPVLEGDEHARARANLTQHRRIVQAGIDFRRTLDHIIKTDPARLERTGGNGDEHGPA